MQHRNKEPSVDGESSTACKNRGQVKNYSYEKHMQKVNLKVNLETKQVQKPIRNPTTMHNTWRRMQIDVIRPICLYMGHVRKMRGHKNGVSESENGQVR